MENKDLIFAYSDYQYCVLNNDLLYAGKNCCEGCKAHGIFCSYIWRRDNEQWALCTLADLSNEPFEKVYCGYGGGYCTRCSKSMCMKKFDNSQDRSQYRAHICDKICAKALETI